MTEDAKRATESRKQVFLEKAQNKKKRKNLNSQKMIHLLLYLNQKVLRLNTRALRPNSMGPTTIAF